MWARYGRGLRAEKAGQERNVGGGDKRASVKLDKTFGDDIFHICTIGVTIYSDTHDQREVLRRSIGVRLVHD